METQVPNLAVSDTRIQALSDRYPGYKEHFVEHLEHKHEHSVSSVVSYNVQVMKCM